MKNENFCTHCGAALALDAQYCHWCGVSLEDEMIGIDILVPSSQHPPSFLSATTQYRSAVPSPQSYGAQPYVHYRPSQPQMVLAPPRKSPGIAAILSFFVIGVGQIYNGQAAKGILLFILAVVFGFTIVGLIVTVIIWIYAIADAYSTAQTINRQYGYLG